MTRDYVNNIYFDWLFNLVCGNRYSKQVSYEKLLIHLHNTNFRYSIPMDENRADDGMNLRYRFALEQGYEYSTELITDELDGPCSVLEMMVALAIHCEEDIMDDPNVGNRAGEWFWGMVVNLGLGSMHDSNYDELYVEEVITRFLDREYEPDGKGGLFTIKNCDRDVRTIEIWFQLCRYLDNIT